MRSVELYLDTAGKSVVAYQLKFPDKKIEGSCEVQENGNLKCGGIEEEIKVELKGQTRKSGTIVFQEGKIIKVIKLVIGDYEYNLDESGKITEKKYEEQVLEETPLRCFDYEEKEDGTMIITGYKCGGYYEVRVYGWSDMCDHTGEVDGEIMDVVIPSKIDGKAVTAIGRSAFMSKGCITGMYGIEGQNARINSVIIPNSVTEIYDEAFHENSLTYIEIPSSVISIGNQAFLNNELERVKINAPKSQITIDNYAFDWTSEHNDSYIEWASE